MKGETLKLLGRGCEGVGIRANTELYCMELSAK
jgi:hypothetical protein